MANSNIHLVVEYFEKEMNATDLAAIISDVADDYAFYVCCRDSDERPPHVQENLYHLQQFRKLLLKMSGIKLLNRTP